MAPGNGRFTQQDTFAGIDMRPGSLHKYLYANADAANKRDPSGHLTLSETSAAQNIMGQLTQMSFRALNFIDKASTVLGVIQTMWQIYSIMENPAIAQHAEQVLNSGDPDFQDLIRNRMSDALQNFRKNSSKIVAKTVQLHGADILNTATQGASGRDRGYLIFLPTPTGVLNAGKIDVPLGRISVKGKSVQVKGRVGGAASHLGRVIGAGSYTGSNNYQQYFRMDYDSRHGHHGTKGPYHWTDGNFHYHVR